MSKEKLQEIKRQYELRKAGIFLDNNDIKKLMKLAYNQALNDAANNAKIKYVAGEWEREAYIDEKSIFKLKI